MINKTEHTMQELEVIVIGAGISGLCAGHKLLESGERNFQIFEREQGVGGTWLASRYPGAGCDIDSTIYSYSFSQNKNWTRKFAKRDEILRYLEKCADDFGLASYIRFNHEMLDATWDESTSRWLVSTNQGNFSAKAMICCNGYLNEPKYPDIPGLDTFQGEILHTAKWDDNTDLSGKRVAVIGTGASTVQVVPAIQPIVKELSVFQRSSGWVLPKNDKPIAGLHHWAIQKIPGYYGLVRSYVFNVAESHIWFMKDPKRMGVPKKDAEKYLEKSIKSEKLKESLRPEHIVGCKRWLFSSEYYPALENSNVNLITDSITSTDASGIITENGSHHPVDVIILATGYQVTNSPFAKRVRNAKGKTLSETWANGQFAYLGINVPEYPNYFTIFGPNSIVAHTSATLIAEPQVGYIVTALQTMKKNNLRKIEVKADVTERYNEEIQSAISKGIWSAGCNSWYIDDNGKNTTVWPFSIRNFLKRTRNFDLNNYNIELNKQPARDTNDNLETVSTMSSYSRSV